MTDDENREIDEAIVDAERAAEMARLHGRVLAQLHEEREAEYDTAMDSFARQLADIEREAGG